MSDILLRVLELATPAEDKIEIGVKSLSDLFLSDNFNVFKIPDYQRPYVWDVEKIESLFVDLKDFYDNQEDETHYYMGTILFHKENEVLHIIDGQQRLTTLLLIDYVINESSSLLKKKEEQFNLFFNSPVSIENIIKNRDYIKSKLFSSINKSSLENFCNEIIVTVITTTSADEAFTFFDSQNNRGISLSPVDFLKSYHLKAIKGDWEDSDKQAVVAKKWDKNNANQFLDGFFNLFLWRSRNWKGGKVYFENKDQILNEFQKRTKDKTINESIRLYANVKNKLASSLDYSIKKGVQISPQPITLQVQSKDYPFSMRQPIQKGVAFFLYADKYYDLYNFMFNEKHESNSDLYLMNNFCNEVFDKSSLSTYIRDFFNMCLLLYFDKFEEEQLYDFTLWLDYLLGSYRIKQKSIVAQTPVKIIRDKQQNLLDVIESAYLPEDVITFIKSITIDEDYKTEISGNGVQGNYKNAILDYYNKKRNENLIEKKNWINDKIRTR
jgi:hypothetical protein